MNYNPDNCLNKMNLVKIASKMYQNKHQLTGQISMSPSTEFLNQQLVFMIYMEQI
jgi:hypothetical protein